MLQVAPLLNEAESAVCKGDILAQAHFEIVIGSPNSRGPTSLRLGLERTSLSTYSSCERWDWGDGAAST